MLSRLKYVHNRVHILASSKPLTEICTHMAITDAWLKANNGRDRDAVTEKTDRDGMSCRVSKKGKIVFQLRYRHNGKQKRVDIGTYPMISLKQARESAISYKSELEKGHDPRIVKKTSKQKNIDAMGLEDMYGKWHKSYSLLNKKNADEIKRTFEIYVFPRFGNVPPDKITADDWLTLLEGIKKNKKAVPMRILINAKQLMAWAKRRRLIEQNNIADLSIRNDLNIIQHPKTRFLSDAELSIILEALDNSAVAPKNKMLIRLCLIYGCRNGELRASKKRDFDLDKMTWTVPPENHKIGKVTLRPIVRPITDDIAEIIEQCLILSEKGEYLFSNVGTSEPMGRSSLSNFPYRLMHWIHKNKGCVMEHWSVHDLRKTARTNFSSLTQPHIAELMLGHKLPGEWQTYDHYLYLDEQEECLTKWILKLKSLY